MSVSLPLSQFPAPRTRILPLLSKQLGGYSARCIMATVEDTSSLPGAGARETEMVGAAPNPLNAEHRSLSSNTSTAQPAVRYCENVGWDGSLALLSMLVVSGAQFYLAYSYSASFRSFHRGSSELVHGSALQNFSRDPSEDVKRTRQELQGGIGSKVCVN